jgi:hypothetical protein
MAAGLKTGSLCPKCLESKVQRMQRSDWMRWLPRSKHYKCLACQTGFLTIGAFVLKLGKT